MSGGIKVIRDTFQIKDRSAFRRRFIYWRRIRSLEASTTSRWLMWHTCKVPLIGVVDVTGGEEAQIMWFSCLSSSMSQMLDLKGNITQVTQENRRGGRLEKNRKEGETYSQTPAKREWAYQSVKVAKRDWCGNGRRWRVQLGLSTVVWNRYRRGGVRRGRVRMDLARRLLRDKRGVSYPKPLDPQGRRLEGENSWTEVTEGEERGTHFGGMSSNHEISRNNLSNWRQKRPWTWMTAWDSRVGLDTVVTFPYWIKLSGHLYVNPAMWLVVAMPNSLYSEFVTWLCHIALWWLSHIESNLVATYMWILQCDWLD
jgi:hypothetical protein